MFDSIVEALVERFTPLLITVGERICAATPGLTAQWPTYEFMCRQTETLAVMTIEHIIVTLLAMAFAILLGVVIGIRVSSAPWPQRGSFLFWPVIGLMAALFAAGVAALIFAPAEPVVVESFTAPKLTSWGSLFSADVPGGMAVFIVIQAVAVLGLSAVLIGGLLPSDADWRVIGVGLLGAVISPLIIPRPILHLILLQVYRLVQLVLPAGDVLQGLAGVLNFVRDAAPLWALVAFILMLPRLSKRITWQTFLLAALGSYGIAAALSVFVIKPGSETTAMVIQLVLFFIFGLMLVLGERAADPVLYAVGVIFTIPSLAMFGIMIPIIGIGVDPAVIALVLYGLLPILRNTITALHELDPAYTEAGRGMGMTDLQLLTQVQMPLALPVILAGVRVSTVMTVGLASIATLIGAGGLGTLIFQGINRTNSKMVLTGAIWIALMAIAFDFILGQGEVRWVSKGIRPDTESTSVQDLQETAGV